MWLNLIRMVLMLVMVFCLVITIYKSYKTIRMSTKTIDETFSRLENQMDAFKYAIIAFAISFLLSLTRGT